MSVKVMAYVWDHSKHRGSELLMLLAIADHANDDGLCWPSIARLAARCRVHKRQAINIIQSLEEAGSITIEHGEGRGNTSIYTVKGAADYTFCTKGVGDCTYSPEKVQRNAPFMRKKVQSSAKKVHSSTVKGAIAIAPEPSEEPSREPSEDLGESAHARRETRDLENFESRFSAPPSRICPPGFVPDPSIRQWAQEQYPGVNYDEAFAAMCDYEFDKPKSDWNAALRTWIRRQATDFNRRSLPRQHRAVSDNPHGLTDKEARTMRNLEAMMHDTEEDDNARRRKAPLLEGPR